MWNLFKVNNKETKTTLITSGVFIVNFEQISTFLQSFHSWLWTSKCKQWRPLKDIIYWSGKKIIHSLFCYMVTRDSFFYHLYRWDTSVGSILLADQFLQLSTKLPSDYLYGFGETSRSSFKRDFTKWHSFGLFSRDQAPYVS